MNFSIRHNFQFSIRKRMQLILDTYGARLSVKEGCFYIKPLNNTPVQFAPEQVKVIMATRGITITTDALLLAVKHDIPVILTDELGRPLGHLWSGKYGSISSIRKQQARFADSWAGMDFIKGLLIKKIKAQAAHLHALVAMRQTGEYEVALKRYNKHYANSLDRFEYWSPERNTYKTLSEAAAAFRAWEGAASKLYFNTLAAALSPIYGFSLRAKRPAPDPFNAALNYVYTILYTYIEIALMKAGLDPALGIMHIDNYNKPAFVYDFIEPYRAWADAVVYGVFFNTPSLNEIGMELNLGEGTTDYRLSLAFRRQLIKGLIDYLNEKTKFEASPDGRPRRRITQIDLAAQVLARGLIDNGNNGQLTMDN